MDITKKSEIITKYGTKEHDTGSPEVQIALFTARIAELTEHMRTHSKDFSTRRGLMALVNKRKRLLKYLSAERHEKYLSLSAELGIRGQK